DLGLEVAVQRIVREAIVAGLVGSAHDCSDGGIFVALAEACIQGGLGATITSALDYFDESPSRIVLSLPAHQLEALRTLAGDVKVTQLGSVAEEPRLRITGVCDLSLTDMRDAYEHGLERAMA